MTKRKTPDLAGAVHSAARPSAAPDRTIDAPAGTPGRARSRRGKRGILIHVEPETARRLKHLAADRDTTLQALGVEALEKLLAEQ